MKDGNFLQIYDLELTTASPLFVGDGNIIRKNLYLFHKNVVSILDYNKLFYLLLQRDKVDAYTQFMMGTSTNLYQFLSGTCKMAEKDWKPAVRYELSVSDGLDSNHSLKDIHTFIRDAYGKVYVPGSSIKGALKTVLLNDKLLNDHARLNAESFNQYRFDNDLNNWYLKLNPNQKSNPINNIMRGIQISDSCTIDNSAMMLAFKKDAHIDGSFSVSRGIVCRECIRPGTVIHAKLTLDRSILGYRITKQDIISAIENYDAYYVQTYLKHFTKPRSTGQYMYQDCLILGGGAGFFSKSLIYPYLGEKVGLKTASKIMQSSFRNHKHDQDIKLGISPHTMEYTSYKGMLYPMGLCKVKIL